MTNSVNRFFGKPRPSGALAHHFATLERPAPQFAEFVLIGVAVSEYLSSLHSTKRDARLHLPSSGSRGSRFPTFPAFPLPGRRYYDPLRLPLLRLGSLRFRSLPDTLRSFATVRVLSRDRCTDRTSRYRTGPFFYTGLPLSRLPLRKERAVLSSSWATPVCACPARRPRRCPIDSPYRFQDYSFPAGQNRRLSRAFARLSSRTANIHFSELGTRPAHSLHLASYTPSWICMQVRYGFGG